MKCLNRHSQPLEISFENTPFPASINAQGLFNLTWDLDERLARYALEESSRHHIYEMLKYLAISAGPPYRRSRAAGSA
jgi:hypothetical protein